jgi:AcrR family transcriptional regulator
MTEAATRRRGRPRDINIDQRALGATRQLLLEEGFAATTIQRIAERSGVHTSAIYRRWPSRIELIQDAAFSDLAPSRVRPTGDLRRDLYRFLRAYVATLKSPLHRAAVPALLGAEAADRPRTPEAWQQLSVRPHFQRILAAAPPGTVDSTISPDEMFDLLLGAALVHALVPEQARPPRPLERTVELIMRLLSPQAITIGPD